MVDPGQALAAAVSHAGVGIVRNGAGDAGALREKLCHAGDLATTAGEGDAAGGDVAHRWVQTQLSLQIWRIQCRMPLRLR